MQHGSMIFWLLFGFFLVFIGFLSIVTGFVQMLYAKDTIFLVQVEDALFVQETLTKSTIVLSGMIRFVLGFVFIMIGNSFMVRGGLHERVCHPRLGDFRRDRVIWLGAERVLAGLLLIFIGFILVLSGIREQVQILFLEQIPVIGQIVGVIAPSASQEQMLHLLIGLILIAVGIVVGQAKKKQK